MGDKAGATMASVTASGFSGPPISARSASPIRVATGPAAPTAKAAEVTNPPSITTRAAVMVIEITRDDRDPSFRKWLCPRVPSAGIRTAVSNSALFERRVARPAQKRGQRQYALTRCRGQHHLGPKRQQGRHPVGGGGSVAKVARQSAPVLDLSRAHLAGGQFQPVEGRGQIGGDDLAPGQGGSKRNAFLAYGNPP